MSNDSVIASRAGLKGSVFLNDVGVPYTGEWGSVLAIQNTVVTTLVSENDLSGNPLMINAADGTGVLTSLTMAEGTELNGHFNYIEIASGAVILNNA
jgi:hypothetical protein